MEQRCYTCGRISIAASSMKHYDLCPVAMSEAAWDTAVREASRSVALSIADLVNRERSTPRREAAVQELLRLGYRWHEGVWQAPSHGERDGAEG